MDLKTKFEKLLIDFEVIAKDHGLARLTTGKKILKTLNLIENNKIKDAESLLDQSSDEIPSPIYVLKGVIAKVQNDDSSSKYNFRMAIKATEATPEILCLNGDFSYYADFLEIAIKSYDRSIEISPLNSRAFFGRGLTYSKAGDVTGAIDSLLRATVLNPDSDKGHIALGDEYRAANMTDAALMCYRTALKLDPKNSAALSGRDQTLALVLPHWHASMLNDKERNNAFDDAISAVVKPGSLVLDIGTGTGLLAMMASRAGAKHVLGCESVGILAEIATKIINQNGFKNKISIVHKHSNNLKLGRDLNDKADILIAELFDTGLLGENIIPTINDAAQRLCKPDVTVIPNGAKVYAVPIESEEIFVESRVENAAGFDIRFFNQLRPNLYLQTSLSKYNWRMLSEPIQVFEFQFPYVKSAERSKKYNVYPNSDGTAHGIVFWFDLQLIGNVSLSTSPAAGETHWKQSIYTLAEPLEVKQNEVIKLHASHNQSKITLSLET